MDGAGAGGLFYPFFYPPLLLLHFSLFFLFLFAFYLSFKEGKIPLCCPTEKQRSRTTRIWNYLLNRIFPVNNEWERQHLGEGNQEG